MKQNLIKPILIIVVLFIIVVSSINYFINPIDNSNYKKDAQHNIDSLKKIIDSLSKRQVQLDSQIVLLKTKSSKIDTAVMSNKEKITNIKEKTSEKITTIIIGYNVDSVKKYLSINYKEPIR
jgi:Na+-transporting NADH:ubiquinone oxidoreductase subunit NqrC